MTQKVSIDRIEKIVGTPRHPTAHFARAVSVEQTVYILHSRECLDSTPDLRECPYSIALDKGIEHSIPWAGWQHLPDRPVFVDIFRGYLVPARSDGGDRAL